MVTRTTGIVLISLGWYSNRVRLLRILPHRLFTEPRARVARQSGATTEIAVDGLVCSACAARVRKAFEALPGVEAVRVDLNTGRATVRHADHAAEADAFARAVEGVVIFRPVRRWLGWIGDLYRRRRRVRAHRTPSR